MGSAETTVEAWSSLQGQVINGALPLGRVIGCSDHSGVFSTRSAEFGSSDLAVKLIRADRTLTESLLPRWKRAARIVHPNLIRLFQWGGCQLDGMPFLYVVMEYADQTLAQVLEHRVLDDDEVHKVLQPTVDALAFLHRQNLVHGQLTSANVLVVGDALKLASDSIRRAADVAISRDSIATNEASAPPDANGGAAEDIRALGACLYQALTRHPPTVPGDSDEVVELPPDFSPKYRDVVARCLSPSADRRPTAAALRAWTGGSPDEPAPSARVEPAPSTPSQLMPVESATVPTPPAATIPDQPRPTPPTTHYRGRRTSIAAVFGAIVILALAWTGLRALQSHRTVAPTAASEQSSAQPHGGGPTEPTGPPPGSSARGLAPPGSGVRQVMPDVSASALRTIRGHVKVWVRVVVDRDGSVFAATADRAGPSRYFERVAIDAAKQWSFPPTEPNSRRLMQIRFDFSRDGPTARAVELR